MKFNSGERIVYTDPDTCTKMTGTVIMDNKSQQGLYSIQVTYCIKTRSGHYENYLMVIDNVKPEYLTQYQYTELLSSSEKKIENARPQV